MKQCEICTNREDCKKYNWVTTMDKGYKLGKPINELMCDNFNTNKTIEIIYLEVKVNGETEITISLPKNLELTHNQRIKKINGKWYKVTYPEGSKIMEEDIKVLEDYAYAMCTISCTTEQDKRIAQAIENLIKRNKELEEYQHKVNQILNLDDDNLDIVLVDNCQKGLKKCVTEFEKENHELKHENKRITDEYMIQKHLINKPFLDKNYIPKSKVIEKIEETNKEIKQMEQDDIGVGFTLGNRWSDLKAKVEGWKELLQKGDTNETKM